VTEGNRPPNISYLLYNELIEKTVVTLRWGEINNGSLPRIFHRARLKIHYD
jgi:hypothetical protein